MNHLLPRSLPVSERYGVCLKSGTFAGVMVKSFKQSINTKAKEIKGGMTAKEFSGLEKTFNFGLFGMEDLSLYQVAFLNLLMKQYEAGENIYKKIKEKQPPLVTKWNKVHGDLPISVIRKKPLIRLPEDDSAEWKLIFETDLVDKTRGPAFEFALKGWQIKAVQVYELYMW